MFLGKVVKGKADVNIPIEEGNDVGIDALVFGTEGSQLLLGLRKTAMIEDGVEFGSERILMGLGHVAEYIVDFVDHTALALGIWEVVLDGSQGGPIAVTDPKVDLLHPSLLEVC